MRSTLHQRKSILQDRRWYFSQSNARPYCRPEETLVMTKPSLPIWKLGLNAPTALQGDSGRLLFWTQPIVLHSSLSSPSYLPHVIKGHTGSVFYQPVKNLKASFLIYFTLNPPPSTLNRVRGSAGIYFISERLNLLFKKCFVLRTGCLSTRWF